MIPKYSHVVSIWAFLCNLLNPFFGFKSLIELYFWIVTVNQHGLIIFLQSSMAGKDVKYENSLVLVLFEFCKESSVNVYALLLGAVINLDYVFLSQVILGL